MLQSTCFELVVVVLALLQTTSVHAAAFIGTANKGSRPQKSLRLRAGASDNDNEKYVLVTGGNKGIGRAICEKLLDEHSDVTVLMGSRDAGRGSQAVSDIESTLGKDVCRDRLHVIPLDTGSDESVQRGVEEVKKITDTLYGIINNAGIMKRNDVVESNNINYFGPRRVCDAFKGMLQKQPSGRIVNIASASGPIFVSSCPNAEMVERLSKPWTIEGGLEELDAIASDPSNAFGGDAYGFSKALVSAFTWWLAKEEPNLIVNAVTPGYILTDMTRGAGASNPPSKGAGPPVWLLMSDELEHVPTGRYYGSDCKRSPLDRYRGPGDPVYEGPDGKETANSTT